MWKITYSLPQFSLVIQERLTFLWELSALTRHVRLLPTHNCRHFSDNKQNRSWTELFWIEQPEISAIWSLFTCTAHASGLTFESQIEYCIGNFPTKTKKEKRMSEKMIFNRKFSCCFLIRRQWSVKNQYILPTHHNSLRDHKIHLNLGCPQQGMHYIFHRNCGNAFSVVNKLLTIEQGENLRNLTSSNGKIRISSDTSSILRTVRLLSNIFKEKLKGYFKDNIITIWCNFAFSLEQGPHFDMRIQEEKEDWISQSCFTSHDPFSFFGEQVFLKSSKLLVMKARLIERKT